MEGDDITLFGVKTLETKNPLG